MKHIFLCMMVLSVAACSDSGNNAEETSAPVRPGVQNVNGNLPDTNNSISLDNNDTIVRKDSVPK